MSELPLSIGTLHFTGIGGIGMSGIAEILFEMGYRVQGSDMSDNANVKRLRAKGIPVMCGQNADNLGDASIVVTSTAIRPDNPEVMAARERFLPIVHRAEMLGELMRLRWSVAVAARMARQRQPRWWQLCLIAPALIPPWSMAASSPAGAAMPGLAKANGWLSKRMSPMVHLPSSTRP